MVLSVEELGVYYDDYLDPLKYNTNHFKLKLALFYEKFDRAGTGDLPYDIVRHSSVRPQDEVTGHVSNDAVYFIYLRGAGTDYGSYAAREKFFNLAQKALIRVAKDYELQQEKEKHYKKQNIETQKHILGDTSGST